MVSTSSEEKYSPYVETLTCRVKVFLRLREEYQFLQKTCGGTTKFCGGSPKVCGFEPIETPYNEIIQYNRKNLVRITFSK
jgi:hypothetical protein